MTPEFLQNIIPNRTKQNYINHNCSIDNITNSNHNYINFDYHVNNSNNARFLNIIRMKKKNINSECNNDLS